MNDRLQFLYDKIETQKNEVFDMIHLLPPEQLSYQPSPGKWSIKQILSHLIMAERLSVNYIQKKILGVEKINDSGLREEIIMLILKISQRIEVFKFKAPRYLKENTVIYSDLKTLKLEWAKTRLELRQLLDKVEDKHLQRKVYKHAVAGYLNIQHALMFFQEHVTHHTAQIRKIVKVLK